MEDPTYPGALAGGPAYRRGAALNPTNRFESLSLHILGEELDRRLVERGGEDGALRRVERTVFNDRTRTIINSVARTPDVPFDWTINPYRGCEHGCIYCFARQYHEFLGLSCGLDFETKLIAKPDAPALLRAELASPTWKPATIVMSAATDVYQPIEHGMRITRGCLEVFAACGHPVSTMTKSALVLRDTDLWSRLARVGAARVTITLVTLDADLARSLEPRASSPEARLRTIRSLTDAGIPVTVNIAPVIPGLTDTEIPRILEAVACAGAIHAAWAPLRLPHGVRDLFLDWLRRAIHPDRARRVESLIERGRFDARGDQVAQTFAVFAKRHGFDRDPPRLSAAHFTRPAVGEVGGQMRLWGT